MSNSLQALFRPASLAVVGASAKPEKLGFQILKNILDAGFAGQVIPVNPKGETILGVPSGQDDTYFDVSRARLSTACTRPRSQSSLLRMHEDGWGIGVSSNRLRNEATSLRFPRLRPPSSGSTIG